MTKQQLTEIITKALGNPTSGPLAEHIDLIADALDQALNPRTTKEKRIISSEETRDTE